MSFEKIFLLPEEGENTSKTYRKACRGIVLDEKKLMPLLFVEKDNYHKLPGGGIEGDEEKIEAFKREILEETGCEIDNIQEVGNVIEQNSTREQISYCYIGEVVKKGIENYTPGEIDKGYLLKWVTINEAISLIEEDLPATIGGKGRQQRDLYILQEISKLYS